MSAGATPFSAHAARRTRAGRVAALAASERYPLTGRELGAVAAFWALFACFRVADAVFLASGFWDGVGFLLPAAAESLCWVCITPAVFWLAEWSEADRPQGVQPTRAFRAVLYAAVGVAAALLVSAVGSWLRLSDLVRTVPRAMRELRPGYWFWFGNAFAVYLGVAAAGLARAHLLRHRSHREQTAELEARLAEAELEALRRQLDPHFLFNTLALIASLVERDPAGARRMIARLSDLLRASLADGGEHEVSLAQELALVEVYLEIMRVRFAGRLEVTTAVDPAARDALVPPLVLQPLVENAIKHGVEKVRGTGRVRIDVARAGDETVLRVRDNGPGADAAPDGVGADGEPHGIGIRNTTARLAQLYGPASGAGGRLVVRAAEGGTEAVVRIPFRTRPGTRAGAEVPNETPNERPNDAAAVAGAPRG